MECLVAERLSDEAWLERSCVVLDARFGKKGITVTPETAINAPSLELNGLDIMDMMRTLDPERAIDLDDVKIDQFFSREDMGLIPIALGASSMLLAGVAWWGAATFGAFEPADGSFMGELAPWKLQSLLGSIYLFGWFWFFRGARAFWAINVLNVKLWRDGETPVHKKPLTLRMLVGFRKTFPTSSPWRRSGSI
jgi:hypothetical protein